MGGGERASRWLTPRAAVGLFTLISTLNYIDRGIIAGAGTTIKGCLASGDECENSKAVECPGKKTVPWNCTSHCRVCGAICDGEEVTQTGFGINTQTLGYLQSSFLVGYMAACLVCAHLVHRVRPFAVLGVAGFVWSIAAVLSGLPNVLCEKKASPHLCEYFWLMLAGRVLSGVGEAAIAVLAVPYLDDVISPNRKGFYMSIYFMSLPVGTALGFVWAGAITSATHNRWEWAFWVEAPLMIPLSLAALTVPNRLNRKHPTKTDGAARPDAASPEAEPLLSSINENGGSDLPSPGLDPALAGPPPPSLLHELGGTLSSPLFLLTSFGYASYSAVVAGLAFYGPLFIQNNRPCDPRWDFGQENADVIFGATVAVTGFFGTALGGLWLDHLARKLPQSRRNNRFFGALAPARSITWQVAVGLGLCMAAAYMGSPAAFFGLLALGCLFLFACTSGINMVINWSVPTELRSMAVALSILILHSVGDVPAPVAIGALADKMSPHLTLVLTLTWLGWAILLWGLGWLYSVVVSRREAAAMRRADHGNHYEDD